MGQRDEVVKQLTLMEQFLRRVTPKSEVKELACFTEEEFKLLIARGESNGRILYSRVRHLTTRSTQSLYSSIISTISLLIT